MFLFLMITSIFQKPTEVLSLNGSDLFSYLVCLILPVKIQLIAGLVFPEKISRVKNFYSQPFRHWPSAVSACKVHTEGKKKKGESSNGSCQSLHSKT